MLPGSSAPVADVGPSEDPPEEPEAEVERDINVEDVEVRSTLDFIRCGCLPMKSIICISVAE